LASEIIRRIQPGSSNGWGYSTWFVPGSQTAGECREDWDRFTRHRVVCTWFSPSSR